jgi:hypothetical protein
MKKPDTINIDEMAIRSNRPREQPVSTLDNDSRITLPSRKSLTKSVSKRRKRHSLVTVVTFSSFGASD